MPQTIQYVLWLSGPLLQGVIGWMMLRRKLHREYPFFLAYTASHVVRFAILFFIYRTGDRQAYRQAYSFMEVIDAVLSFAVVYELYATTFRAYQGIRELGWMLLRWATVVLMVVAVVSAASAPGSDSDRFLAGLFTVERSITLVFCGLLFLLFLFHISMGLRWKTTAFGIALGFGVISSLWLVTFALRTHLGSEATSVLSLISSIAYSCAIVAWLFGVLRPAQEPGPVPRASSWDIEGWNRTLLELLQR